MTWTTFPDHNIQEFSEQPLSNGKKCLFYWCVNRLSIKTGWKGTRYPYFTSIRTLTYPFMPIFLCHTLLKVAMKAPVDGLRPCCPSSLPFANFPLENFLIPPEMGKYCQFSTRTQSLTKQNESRPHFPPSPKVSVGSWNVSHQNQHWRTGKRGSRKGVAHHFGNDCVPVENGNTGWN